MSALIPLLGLVTAIIVLGNALLALMSYRANARNERRLEDQRRALKAQDHVLAAQDHVLAEQSDGIAQVHVLVNDRLSVALEANSRQEIRAGIQEERIQRLEVRMAAIEHQGATIPADHIVPEGGEGALAVDGDTTEAHT